MNKGAFAAVINENDQILLVRSMTHKRFNDHWSIPGGVAEDDESLEECAVREIIEETGVKCQVKNLIMQVQNPEDNISVEIFYARYVSGNIKIQVDEIAEARWFSFTTALELPLAFNAREIIELLVKS